MKFHESNRFTRVGKQKIALVDIDETICFYPDKRRYDLAIPESKNIEKINKLYEEGWKIIYWTSRGAVSGVDYKKYTLSQLKDWNCKFHELQCGDQKPHFDLIVDDKAKRIEEI